MSILPPSEPQHCHTCRWGWRFENMDNEEPQPMGECHRHAPQPYPAAIEVSGFSSEICWPVVRAHDGCGDWASRWGV